MSLTSTTASRPGRSAVAPVAATLAASLLLGGCSFTSRNLTLEPYAPSDGLQTDLGDVLVRNVLIVSEGDGAAGVVSGALVNRGDDDTVVSVEVSGSTAFVDVAAGQTVFLSSYDSDTVGSGDDVQVLVESVLPPAGGAVEVSFRTDPATDSASFEVPVLPPEGPYADLLPSGATGGTTAEPGGVVSVEPGPDPAEVPGR